MIKLILCYAADVDECKSNILSCNTASDNCVNTIGSYRCECKDGFRNVSGQCEGNLNCISLMLPAYNEVITIANI